ncbi:MAG TPA: hypothetical protein VGN20_20610 [Mucilaginibacter sp.]|jgi:hypothetical protein
MKKLILIASITCCLLCAKAQVIPGPSDVTTPPPNTTTNVTVGKVFVAGQTIGINDDTTSVNNATNSTTAGWKFTWYKQKADGSLSTSTITAGTYTEVSTTPGWYYYGLAATNVSSGCSSPMSSLFTVYVAPQITGSVTATTATVCINNGFTLTANVISPSIGVGYLYQWKKNGVNIDRATNQTYTDTEPAVAAIVFTCSISYNWGLAPDPLPYSVQVSKTISIVAAVGKPGIK